MDENDLLEKIASGRKKSINLDFKALDSLQNTEGKKKEITKNVSAFADSQTVLQLEHIHRSWRQPLGMDA
jgi:hypothetical protein